MNESLRAHRNYRTVATVSLTAALVAVTGNLMAEQDRGTSSEKGSLILFPHVEVRWENAPPFRVIQDTFLHLTNDYPAAVDVKLYFFNGDPPIVAEAAEWNGPPAGYDDPELFPRVGEAREHAPAHLSQEPAGGHGIGGLADVPAEFCENTPLTGEQTGVNTDTFGDSHQITRSWAELEHPDGTIELPSVGGTFDVNGPSGNAICRDLDPPNEVWDYPCIIGAPGETFTNTVEWPIGSGNFFDLTLPGEVALGRVDFAVSGYTFQEDDPDSILLRHRITSVDLCETNLPACRGTLEGSWSQELILDVLHPAIAIDKTADITSVCQGEDTPVTYSYTVTNPGNIELSGVLGTIMDDMCGPLVFIGGDTDGDTNLDPTETWEFECSTIINTATTSTVDVTGFTVVPLCQASASDSVTIPAINCNGEEEEHPGWNFFDNLITLTANEPSYWSAATGLPKGVGRWEILDPNNDGMGPGRVDPDDPSQRYLRGFVVAFAVQQVPTADEIRWNHLAGDATIVNYREENAWQYGSPAYQIVGEFGNGDPTGTPGTLSLDGNEYAQPGQLLLLNFIASNSEAYSGTGFPIMHDTQLTLMPLYGDFRQETTGPRTTKAAFDIWNENEVKFTNLDQCVTCWSSVLVSRYPIPNHFLMSALHTDAGKVRIDGLTSGLCAPENALATPMVGVATKRLSPNLATGQNLFDLGTEDGTFLYDVSDPPPEGHWDPNDVAGESAPEHSLR